MYLKGVFFIYMTALLISFSLIYYSGNHAPGPSSTLGLWFPTSLSPLLTICLHSPMPYLLPPLPSHCSVFLLFILHSPPLPPPLL